MKGKLTHAKNKDKDKLLEFYPIKIIRQSELVQLKLNIETSKGDYTPTEAEYGVPIPLEEVGVSRLDQTAYLYHVHLNAFFQVNEHIAQLISYSGQSREDVYRAFSSVWLRNEFNQVLEDLERVSVLRNDENDWNLAKRSFCPSKKPLTSITLLVTQECNLHCTYCYAGDGEYDDKGRMSTDVAFKAVEFLLKESGFSKNLSVIFFGGEPLMNFELIERVVSFSRERERIYGKHIHFSMTCNGTLISETIQSFLQEHRIRVQISIDGDKETHDFNRFLNKKFSSHDEIIDRTKSLRERQSLTSRATITNKQMDLVHTFHHLVSLGFRLVSMSPAVTMIELEDFKTLTLQYIRLVNEFQKLVANGEYARARKMANVMSVLEKLHNGGLRTHYCGAATNMCAVDIRGNLFPCHRFVSNKEYKFGDVINGIDRPILDQFIHENHIENRSVCSTCWARNLCAGGCPHENLIMNKDVRLPYEPSCVAVRAFLNEILKLYAWMTDDHKKQVLGSYNEGAV